MLTNSAPDFKVLSIFTHRVGKAIGFPTWSLSVIHRMAELRRNGLQVRFLAWLCTQWLSQ